MLSGVKHAPHAPRWGGVLQRHPRKLLVQSLRGTSPANSRDDEVERQGPAEGATPEPSRSWLQARDESVSASTSKPAEDVKKPAANAAREWKDVDSTEKQKWSKVAFAEDFFKKRSFYRDVETETMADASVVTYLEESEARNRFVRRTRLKINIFSCLVPTGVAFLLGCLAYVMQELGFSGLSVLGHNLVAGLLGFLMAFVTSTNYNRWLQARSALCNITILTIDIASRADVFLTTKDADGLCARRETARFLRLLYTSIILTLTDSTLWGQDRTEEAERTSKELRKIMMEEASPSERRILLSGGPRDLPFLVIDLLRAHINQDTTLKSFVHNTFGSQFIAINCQDSLRNKVDDLFPALGNCLALALTPLPMGYRTIFSTLLSVLVYTFPFALVSEVTWETPIVAAFLAFGYYGVYSMSLELLYPFRPRPEPKDTKQPPPGIFSCNADWVRVMNAEFNRVLISPTATTAATTNGSAKL